jgi:DNA-3-methyladenine glycosylase II
MASRRLAPQNAARLLAERDPVIGRLVADVGLPRLPPPDPSHFASLVRSVTHQQLAGAAARAIHARLVVAVGGVVTPESLVAAPTGELRAAGLSAGKVASVRDLAARVLDGTVILDPRRLGRQGDEEVVARLTVVRGIGRWSAQMFLMFQLRRPDVWPTGDLGVRRGYALAWGVPDVNSAMLEPLGEPFRPFRTVVAWYCWRALHVYAGATPSAVTGGRPDDGRAPGSRRTRPGTAGARSGRQGRALPAAPS